MSLLGRQVFANPTTPIWGQGGGGGTTIPYGTPLTFDGPGNDPTLLEMNADSVLGVVDASANYGSFQTGDLRVYGAGEGGSSFINFGTGFGGSNAPLGIRAVYADGTLQNTLAEFTSGGWDLSNVQTINGGPATPALTRTNINDLGGDPVPLAPSRIVLNSYSFTAPANGIVSLTAYANFTSATSNVANGVMNFELDGTPGVSSAWFGASARTQNTSASVCEVFSVSGGDVLPITAVASIPVGGTGASGDFEAFGSRIMVLFTPS